MKSIAALLAGIALTPAFAPFNWWPLGIVSFAVLFMLWLKASTAKSYWYGFMYGLGMFGSGISWMYISLHDFGNMPAELATISIFGLVAFMSLYPALAGLIQAWFKNKHTLVRLVIIMPCAWLLLEWLRGWLLTGLPWLTAGYIMLDTPAAGLIPIGGVYLLSLALLVTTGIFIALFIQHSRLDLLVLLLLITIWFSGWYFQDNMWTKPSGKPISVAIIQNNVPISMKWDEAENKRIVDEYLHISDGLKNKDDYNLVVWPEAAVPDYLDNLEPEFWSRLEAHSSSFVFGVVERLKYPDGLRTFNSVVAYDGGGQATMYRKQHLVPFGEFFPFQFILKPILEQLKIPMSNFSPWTSMQQPLGIAGTSAAMTICYEDAFPNESRSQIYNAGILINVSEDAWFGDSLAPHQRLQMARFRSLESGRPMIRSSNSGLSSLIDASGKVRKIAPQFKRAVVTGNVQPRHGITPYILYGDQPVLLFCCVLLIMSVFTSSQKKQPYSLL